MIKNIIRNYLFLGMGQGLSGLFYFLATVFLARNFGVEKFGMFNFSESIFLFFSLVALFGSDVIGTREIAQRESGEDSKIASITITLRFFTSMAAFLLLLIFALVIKNTLETKLLIMLCGISIFSFILLFDWFFYGIERFDIFAKYTVIRDLFFLAATVYLVGIKKEILFVGAAFVLSKFIFSFLLFFRYVKMCGFPKPAAWKAVKQKRALNSYNMIFWASIIAWVVNYFDIAFISLLHKEKAAGYYSAAYKPVFYITMAIVIYSKAVFPLLARFKKVNLAHFRKIMVVSLSGMLIIFLPLVILGCRFSEKIIPFIYGKDYFLSAGAFRILVFLILIVSINIMYYQGLLACGREKENLKVIFTVGLSNVLLNLMLIPAMGINGAAWSKVLSQGFGCVYYYKIFKFLGIKHEK